MIRAIRRWRPFLRVIGEINISFDSGQGTISATFRPDPGQICPRFHPFGDIFESYGRQRFNAPSFLEKHEWLPHRI